MKAKWNPNILFNEAETTLAVFMEYYNNNIPESYPKATEKALKAFQKAYPALFDGSNKWSIDHHRKRLMDWLPSYKEEKEEV